MKEGICGRADRVVSGDDTALTMKSGGLMVLATPAVVSLMEQACYESIENLLDDGISSVGVLVNIRHIASTAVGKNVRAESKLINVEGRHLVFEVAAFDDDKKIAYGTHERVIIDCRKFMQKLSS